MAALAGMGDTKAKPMALTRANNSASTPPARLPGERPERDRPEDKGGNMTAGWVSQA